MRKFVKYVAVATCILAVTSCSKQKFHVAGEITEAEDSVLYFENMSLDGVVTLDSVKLDDDGKFEFSGEPGSSPEFYRLRIADQIINVSIDSLETVTVKAKYPTMASQYEISGSDNCQRIKELALLQQDLYRRAIAIDNNTSLGVKQAADSIIGEMEVYKNYVIANYILPDPKQASAYFALFQTLGSNLIFNPKDNKNDIRTFAAVATSWEVFYPNAERTVNLANIAKDGLNSVRVLEARKQDAQTLSNIKVSNIIDVPLLDNKGHRRSLTELVGKVVILDFHAFSMQGSTERIMQLREIYEKYRQYGLEIYQVGVDPNEHFWKTQTAALPWINVYDPDGTESQYLMRYNVSTIPTFFLVDRSNALYKRDVQIKDLDAEIQGLLK